MRRALGVLLLFLLPGLAVSAPLGTRTVLENGLILLHSEQRSLPLVTLRLILWAGTAVEPPEKSGLANLTAQLLSQGTADRSAQEVAEAIDTLGGRLGFLAEKDFVSVGLTVLREDLEAGLTLLSELIQIPSFPEEEFKQKISQNLARIHQEEQDPHTVTALAFQGALYGSHPYGRRTIGTPEELKNLTREDVVNFHRERYLPEGAIVAVVGDISQKEAREALAGAFGGWLGGPARVPTLSLPEGPKTLNVVKIDRPVSQAQVLFGHPGLERDDPDFYAVLVMNYILGGGGFESRLLDNIRDNLGLAYSVSSRFSTGLHGGTFRAGLQTSNETANQALEELFKEVRRIQEVPVTKRELSDAKDFLTGSFPLRLSSNRGIASMLTQVELHHLGLDYSDRYPEFIRAVSQEDVLRVAQKYLRPGQAVLVILSDEEKAALQY